MTTPYVATYDEIATQLVTNRYRPGPYYGAATDGTVTVDITALATESQQLARWALEAWTNVTGIEFRFVAANANIAFREDQPGAGFYGISRDLSEGVVNVSAEWLGENSEIGSAGFRTYLHEIGHALGLGHPGDYPKDPSNPNATTYENDAKFLNDSTQASVMSYFSQTSNTHIDASYAEPVTPMIADIIAIQNLYGVPTDINVGDTIYGYGSNVGGYLGLLFSPR